MKRYRHDNAQIPGKKMGRVATCWRHCKHLYWPRWQMRQQPNVLYWKCAQVSNGQCRRASPLSNQASRALFWRMQRDAAVWAKHGTNRAMHWQSPWPKQNSHCCHDKNQAVTCLAIAPSHIDPDTVVSRWYCIGHLASCHFSSFEASANRVVKRGGGWPNGSWCMVDEDSWWWMMRDGPRCSAEMGYAWCRKVVGSSLHSRRVLGVASQWFGPSESREMNKSMHRAHCGQNVVLLTDSLHHAGLLTLSNINKGTLWRARK